MTERIDFNAFRKEWSIPAADLRAICKKLDIQIVKDEEGIFWMGEYNMHSHKGISTKDLIECAIREYRMTMNIKMTIAGKLSNSTMNAINNLPEDAIPARTPSIKKKPNIQSSSLIVAKEEGASVGITAPAAPNPALETLLQALTAAQRPVAPPDPLQTQRQLLEAEKQGFLITTEQVGQLLGMSKSTISSKKSGFRKLGFEFIRIKEGSTTLWKVFRYKIKDAK